MSSLIKTPHGLDAIIAKRISLYLIHKCIYIEAEKELCNTIPMFVGHKTFFNVEYSWKSKACAYCKNFGHVSSECNVEREYAE